MENLAPIKEIDQPAPGNLSSFRLNSISEVIANQKPPVWLIKSYIPHGSITCLFGPSGEGKSFVVIDWGLHIATDGTWCGHKIRKPGAVVYVVGEGHSGIPPRAMAWAIKNDVDLSKVNFFISRCAAQLSDVESAAEVATEIQRIVDKLGIGVVLIIVDTLARNFGPGNESSAEDMSQFITHIDIYLRQRFDATIVIVHHTGHTNKDRARGSSSFEAALDCSYKLERIGDGLIKLTNTKMKDAEPPGPVTLEMNQIELEWCDEEGVPLTSIAISQSNDTPHNESKGLGAKQRALLSLLGDMHEDMRKGLPDDTEDEKTSVIEVRQWKEHAEYKGLLSGKYIRQDFQKIKKTLLDRKLIRIDGCYVYVVE